MPERKTVGQLMEEMRLKAGAQNYHGHEYMDLERFAEDTRHKLKTLEAQKTEAENLEIVQMVRALRLTPEQLNAMLSGGTVPGMAAASANYNEQEDTDHEE